MFLLLTLQILALEQAPKQIVAKNYCVSSLFAEPDTGCISWNRHETAGPLLDEKRQVLYIGGSDGYLHIVSPISGKVLKRIALPGSLLTTPTLLEDILLVGTNQGSVIKFDIDTWNPVWQQKLGSELTNPIVTNGNKAYVVSGVGTLHALDLETGELLWEKRHTANTLGLSMKSNPLIAGDKLVLGSDSGKLEFLDLASGAALFSLNLGDTKKPYPGIVADPVAIGSNQIAVASFNQGVFALDATTGAIRWSVPHLPNITRLALSDKSLIAAGPRYVYAIDLASQKILWKFDFKKGSPNRLIVKNGAVYLGSDSAALYVLNAASGRPLSNLGSGLGFAADFDFSSDATLFAVSTAGYLYKYGRKKT
ncbi:MAG: PQQ-binding-like beta-propeller repeat protein [Myxococcota bacterium]